MAVLRDGPMPLDAGSTRDAERALGIPVACVYAYLGRTLEAFGNSAIVVDDGAVRGHMSPFDTGGLVNNIAPVSGWPEASKRQYLASYSWPTAQFDNVVALYPDGHAAGRSAYIAGSRPSVDGPHITWPGREEADIWASNNDWRAWTWEGRGSISAGAQLRHWTCPPAVLAEITKYAERTSHADGGAWFEELLARYVAGGVSRLVRNLRAEQGGAP